MPLFHINVFGGFQLSTSKHSHIKISAKKAKALLAYLALHSNQRHQRESLATLLWEDCSSTQARHSLRQTIGDLRKAIPDAEQLIDSDQQSLQLRKDLITVDALNFDNLCIQNDNASLQQALDFYKGELLEGLYTRSQNFDDWLETERSHKREKVLQIMDVLLEQAQSEGKLEQMIRLGIKMTALDPLRESAHRMLMDAYHKQGRRGSALKQYRLCQQLLRDQLEIAPDNKTQTLYQAIFQQQKSLPNKQATSISAAENQHKNDEIENSSVPQLVNQLRQVTLLSVQIHTGDVVYDPESQFHQYQQIVSELKKHIGLFHATVVEMQNANLLVVFGLPAARTNDTEMAVRAAFAMHESLENMEQKAPACSIKIGISSGQIYLVDCNPDDLQPQSLSGSTLQQAILLAGLAQPGQILIAKRAYTTIAGLVAADELTDTDNIDHSSIWNLTEIDHKIRQPASNLVGRQFELQQFLTAARNCKETEYGQLILVRGEPGIGKTRLLKEWLTLASDLEFNCHFVSIFNFGTSMGQSPVQSLTRSLLQLQPDSELAQIKTCASKIVAENILSNEQVNFLFDLLNVPELILNPEIYQAMENEARQSGKQEVITTLVQRFSERQSLLIIMEDIHWAEQTLLTLLGQLAADIKDYPIILVFSTRFEGEPLDPLWRSQIQSTPLLTLDVSPLRQKEAEQLVKQTLDLVAEKTAELIQRSGCNPLFLEQLLFCVEQAVDVIPDSVQSIIAAKLDTLGSFDKRAVFVASILGQRFSLEPLKYILDNPNYDCSELLVRGLIKPDGSQFLFHHALVLDGIYTIQLPSQRRSLHLLAADWYNDKDPLLYAQHLDKAESDKAASAYLKAAEYSIKLYQYDRAEKMARRGKEIAKETEGLFDLSLCRADCLRELGQSQSSLEAFIEAEQQVRSSPKQQCQALIGQGYALRQLDRHSEVLSLIKTTEPLAESINDIKALATLHYLRGNACFFLGDIDNCLLAHQKAEAISADYKLPIIQIHSLSGLADANYAMGRMITAEQQYSRCIALCKQYDLIRDATANQVMLGIVLGFVNRFDDAVKILLETLELAKKVRNIRAETLSLGKLGYMYTQTNEQKSAELCANQYLQLSKQSGSTLSQCHALLYLGILDKNEPLLVQAYELASTNPLGKNHISSWILAAQAWVTDDSDKRTWALQEGEKLLSEYALSHNQLMFYRYSIETCLDTKDYDKAQYYMAALKYYTAKEPLPWSEFIIQRAKALIRTGQGETGDELEQNLQELINQADQSGFVEAKACMVTALQQINQSNIDWQCDGK